MEATNFMKKAISILAITVVIAGLVISSATGAIQQSQVQDEVAVKANIIDMKEAMIRPKMQKQFIANEKVALTSTNANVMAQQRSVDGLSEGAALDDLIDAYHPTMADASDDNVILGYEYDYENTTDPSENEKTCLWLGSNDNASNFEGGIIWVNSTTDEPLEVSYPSSMFWGVNDTNDVFYATHVAEPGIHSAEMFLMKVEGDPTLQDSYSGVSWDWASNGHANMRASTITCDDSQNPWEYGLISMVMDYDAYTNAPCMSYADQDDANSGWISRYAISGARTCGGAIDGEDAADGYPTYILWDLPYGGNDSLLIGFDYFEDWSGTGGSVYWYGPDYNIRKPCGDASEGAFVFLTEFWILNTTTMLYDKDVVAWHYNYSNPDHVADGDINLDWVGGTIYDETTPAIQHVSGLTYVATYIRNNTLIGRLTDDGGVTWGPEVELSGDDFVWTDDEADARFIGFRNQDIADYNTRDGSVKIAWGYDSSALVFNTYKIHYAEVGVAQIVLCGDFNAPGSDTGGDGGVNIADLTFLVAYLFGGGASPDPLCAADVNHDGAVNIADLTYLVAYLFGGGPEPSPECCNPPF